RCRRARLEGSRLGDHHARRPGARHADRGEHADRLPRFRQPGGGAGLEDGHRCHPQVGRRDRAPLGAPDRHGHRREAPRGFPVEGTRLMSEESNLDGLRAWTHVIYGLHALSVLVGVTTAAFIVTAFAFGLPSIVAVILNYLKRAEARGTFLESHFRWQIRTFWF